MTSMRFQICLFDDHIFQTQMPYAMCRPSFTVPVGSSPLFDKVAAVWPDYPVSVICHSNHVHYINEHYPKTPVNTLNKSLPTLFINGRLYANRNKLTSIESALKPDKNHVFVHKNDVLAIFCNTEANELVFKALTNSNPLSDILSILSQSTIKETMPDACIFHHWWDYIQHLSFTLTSDFSDQNQGNTIEGQLANTTVLINEYTIAIDKHATVSDFVVLDASNGPITIDAHVTIEPFVEIKGPCYIDQHSTIHHHASIKESYIGKWCKVGGEVSRSIIQAYTNKAHDGYLGDSMIGEWCNLGAGTTVSNLKLSYGTISSFGNTIKSKKSTECQFLGVCFGDFVKTGIQSNFNCGTMVSNACSLIGTHPHSTFVPPFTFGSAPKYSKQTLKGFLTALERMKSRRDQILSDAQSALFKNLFKH